MTTRDVSSLLPSLLGPIEIHADGEQVALRDTWNFVGFGLTDDGEALNFAALAVVGGQELPLVLGEETTTSTVATRKGSRNIDLSFWPATAGALVRRLRLIVTLDSSVEDATATIDLYDQTHGVVVTGTELDNAAADDKTIPTEIESDALTVGSASGDLRSDEVAMYLLRIRRVGATASDAVTCTNARLVIDYVAA